MTETPLAVLHQGQAEAFERATSCPLFDAPKGPNKKAQGIALGLRA